MVLCCLDMRNDRSFQFIIIFIHVDHELFFNFFRYIFIFRLEGFDGAIFFIGNFIEGRYIDARNLCCFQKKILSAATGLLVCFVSIKKGSINHFTFSDIEKVKERCKWLRIVCTRASADHQRIILCTFFCKKRDSAEIQ